MLVTLRFVAGALTGIHLHIMQALAQTLANKTQDAAIVRELVMDIRGRELRTVQLGRTACTIHKLAIFADVLTLTVAATE